MQLYIVSTFPEAQLVPSAAPGATTAEQEESVELRQYNTSQIGDTSSFRVFRINRVQK